MNFFKSNFRQLEHTQYINQGMTYTTGASFNLI